MRQRTAFRWSSGSRIWLALIAVLLAEASAARVAGAMQMASGSYTGDGAAARAVTGVGFRPDAVIVKGDTAQLAVMRTATMAGDASKELAKGAAFQSQRIRSLDGDGFTVGAHAEVNGHGVAYSWVAFRDDGSGDFRTGSYAGTGSDNRSIGGLGFQPSYVIVMSAAAQKAVQRSSAMLGDTSLEFDKTGPEANWIQALGADGFQVGTDAHVNAAGTTYHYAAWKAGAGRMSVGSYAGNGMDNRSVAGAGFRPDYLIVKATAKQPAIHRTALMAGDSTLSFTATASTTNAIQGLLPDGFQVGSAPSANASNATYYWMAFHAGLVAAPTAALAITSVNAGAHPIAGVGFPVVVEARNADGTIRNVAAATGVRLSLKTGSGSLGGTLTGTIPAGASQVVISGVTYTKAEGGVVLTVARTSGDALAPGDGPAFIADPGAITGYTVNLSSPQSAGFTFGVVVTALDQFANRVTSDNSTLVTLASSSGHVRFDGNLDGTFGDATKPLSTGAASVNARGTTAEATTVTATDANGKTGSASLTVTVGAASTLAFTTQPGTALAGTVISGPPTVAVQDGFGNTITSSKAAITVAIGTNSGGGTLGGTTKKSAASGVASFSNLTISKQGSGYTLTASAAGLAGATSNPFTITGPTGTITGRVTGSADGAAVMGAAVAALQSGVVKASTTAGDDGTYSLSALAPGTYDVHASATGYQSQTRNGITVAAGSAVTVNVSLAQIGGPTIRITAPASGSVITSGTIFVRGDVSAPAGHAVGVSVNGVPGVVEGGQFAAVVPVDPTVASLTATLNDFSGVLTGDTVAVSVSAAPAEATVRLQAHPPGGVAPLAVAFSLSSVVAARQITLKVDSPGVPDFQGTTLDGVTVAYTQPGLYAPTALVVDTQGLTHTATTLVQVFNLVVLDAQLQATWNAFKDAVRASDLGRAGSFLHSDTRAAYQAQLANLVPGALTSIDQIMTTIQLVEVGFGGAQYEMLRQGPDRELSFAVWFQIDQDGVWRLRKF